MKTTKGKCMRIFMLAVMMFVMSGYCSVFASESTLVEFNYDSSGKITGEKLVEYGDKEGYSPTSGHGNLLCYMATGSPRALEWSDPEYSAGDKNIVPIVRASNKNMWGSVPSFAVTLSTKGFTNINFSAKMAGSSNGPAEWKLQYSTDGKNYLDIAGSQIVIGFDTRKNMTDYYSNFGMPEAVADKDIIYIRIIAASDKTVVGGNYLNMPWGGETAINNICIRGTDIASIQTTTPPPQTTTAKKDNQQPTTQKQTQTTTTKKPTQTTKSNSEKKTTTASGNKKNDETETTKAAGGNKTNSTSAAGTVTQKSENKVSAPVQTHIITETNASGETITSIVYEETTEETTAKSEEKESEETTIDKDVKKTEVKKDKGKVSTSGEIEKTSDEENSGNTTKVILIVGVVLFIITRVVEIIVRKKRNKG